MKRFLFLVVMVLSVFFMSACSLSDNDDNEEIISVINEIGQQGNISENVRTGSDFDLGQGMSSGKMIHSSNNSYIGYIGGEDFIKVELDINIDNVSDSRVVVEDISIRYYDYEEEIYIYYGVYGESSEPIVVYFDMSFDDLFDKIEKLSIEDIEFILIELGFDEVD